MRSLAAKYSLKQDQPRKNAKSTKVSGGILLSASSSAENQNVCSQPVRTRNKDAKYNGRLSTWLHCFVRVFEASNVLGIEPELAVSVVSNTITDIDHCTSTGVALQHNGRPEMR